MRTTVNPCHAHQSKPPRHIPPRPAAHLGSGLAGHPRRGRGGAGSRRAGGMSGDRPRPSGWGSGWSPAAGSPRQRWTASCVRRGREQAVALPQETPLREPGSVWRRRRWRVARGVGRREHFLNGLPSWFRLGVVSDDCQNQLAGSCTLARLCSLHCDKQNYGE